MQPEIGNRPEIAVGEPGKAQSGRKIAKPTCPRCGWTNTRPSVTHTALDTLTHFIGLRPFRCRSCGKRFHTFRRKPEE